jgi:hypothetical protein
MPNYTKTTQTGTDKGGNPVYVSQQKRYKKDNARKGGSKGRKKASTPKPFFSALTIKAK